MNDAPKYFVINFTATSKHSTGNSQQLLLILLLMDGVYVLFDFCDAALMGIIRYFDAVRELVGFMFNVKRLTERDFYFRQTITLFAININRPLLAWRLPTHPLMFCLMACFGCESFSIQAVLNYVCDR